MTDRLIRTTLGGGRLVLTYLAGEPSTAAILSLRGGRQHETLDAAEAQELLLALQAYLGTPAPGTLALDPCVPQSPLCDRCGRRHALRRECGGEARA